MPPLRDRQESALGAECGTVHPRSGRCSTEEVASLARLLASESPSGELLDALPQMVLVVNEHRQAVAVNGRLLEIVGCNRAQALGRRPGEILGCPHSSLGMDGCGTAPACEICGAVEAIECALVMNRRSVREARVRRCTTEGEQWLDLRVTAQPFSFARVRLVLVVLEDISQIKRLEVLQRVFFHDVLNTIGCLSGYVRCLQEGQADDRRATINVLAQLTADLTDEIEAHRDLIAAEAGRLTIERHRVEVLPLLCDLRAQFLRHTAAQGRTIVVDAPGCKSSAGDCFVETDPRLVRRVLANMLKNALEAVPPGATVALRARCAPEYVRLSVHNPGEIPPKIRQQIFERSFSTKSESGRGIGTYSMKLLGERYLGGEIWFESSTKGTEFFLELPKYR